MELKNFKPISELVTTTSRITNPKFSAIDAHNHLGSEFGGNYDKEPLSKLLEILDQSGIVKYVDLDGGWGEGILENHLKKFKEPAPDRFLIFGGVAWEKWNQKGDRFGEWAAKRLRIQKERGAEGLKIWKNLGLTVRDHNNQLVKPSDKRLKIIWETAAEIEFPVMIHLADPVAFFNPVDEFNERWEELNKHPEWQFSDSRFPSFHEIIQDFRKLVQDNPNTTFIGAHVGCQAENLNWVSSFLDQCPNLFVDISARIGELGRQPYSSRDFFLRYRDRILFGSDMGPNNKAYQIIYRFLESKDEFFDYSDSEIPAQGRWKIYGIGLPDDVLRKVYFDNAKRILLKD